MDTRSPGSQSEVERLRDEIARLRNQVGVALALSARTLPKDFQSAPILSLGLDLQLVIMRLLEPKALAYCGEVCRYLLHLCRRDDLWSASTRSWPVWDTSVPRCFLNMAATVQGLRHAGEVINPHRSDANARLCFLLSAFPAVIRFDRGRFFAHFTKQNPVEWEEVEEWQIRSCAVVEAQPLPFIPGLPVEVEWWPHDAPDQRGWWYGEVEGVEDGLVTVSFEQYAEGSPWKYVHVPLDRSICPYVDGNGVVSRIRQPTTNDEAQWQHARQDLRAT